jgi:hypothetical protein
MQLFAYLRAKLQESLKTPVICEDFGSFWKKKQWRVNVAL